MNPSSVVAEAIAVRRGARAGGAGGGASAGGAGGGGAGGGGGGSGGGGSGGDGGTKPKPDAGGGDNNRKEEGREEGRGKGKGRCMSPPAGDGDSGRVGSPKPVILTLVDVSGLAAEEWLAAKTGIVLPAFARSRVVE